MSVCMCLYIHTHLFMCLCVYLYMSQKSLIIGGLQRGSFSSWKCITFNSLQPKRDRLHTGHDIKITLCYHSLFYCLNLCLHLLGGQGAAKPKNPECHNHFRARKPHILWHFHSFFFRSRI